MSDTLSTQYEYVTKDDGVHMLDESEIGPGEVYTVGKFVVCRDYFYRFKPEKNIFMTCKALREAAKKCSQLNEGI